MENSGEAIDTIIRLHERGLLTHTEAFWQIVAWAGGADVTDEDLRRLPQFWKQRFINELRDRPATRQAWPGLLRSPPYPADADDATIAASLNELRLQRDRAFDRLKNALMADDLGTSFQKDGQSQTGDSAAE
jgi:hypothetical protein